MGHTPDGERRLDGLLRTMRNAEREIHELIGAEGYAPPSPERAWAWVAATQQRAILDALPANVSLLDASGRIVTVNEAWRRFANDNSLASPTAGVGQSYLAVCDAAVGPFSSEASEVAAGIRAVLSGSREEFTLEYPCDAPGRPRWFRLSVRPVKGDGGAVVMHVDISQERVVMLALRQSEERLRAIVDNVPECVKLVSLEGRLIDINPAGLHLLGADRLADVRGCSTVQLVHPDDRAAFEALHQRVIAGESGRIEIRCVGLCGTERWLEIHSTPLRTADGSVGTVLSIARDISEQRRIEDERRELLLREQVDRRRADEASRYYRTLFASAPGCYLVLTPDHSTIVEASEAFLKVTATTRMQIIGRSLFEVFPDDPDDPKADGEKSLRASLDRVIAMRQADVMAVQRYPIRRRRVREALLEHGQQSGPRSRRRARLHHLPRRGRHRVHQAQEGAG